MNDSVKSYDEAIKGAAERTDPNHDPHRWAHLALACIHAALTLTLLADGFSHILHAACEGGAAATYLALFRASGRG